MRRGPRAADSAWGSRSLVCRVACHAALARSGSAEVIRPRFSADEIADDAGMHARSCMIGRLELRRLSPQVDRHPLLDQRR